MLSGSFKDHGAGYQFNALDNTQAGANTGVEDCIGGSSSQYALIRTEETSKLLHRAN
jgi:hypothetical protein